MVKKAKTIIVKEKGPSIKEVKKEEVNEEPKDESSKEVEKEEDFDDFVEDLWEDRQKQSEREPEDAFNPKGLILESGQEAQIHPATLEDSLGDAPDTFSDQGDMAGNDMYNTGQDGGLYGAGADAAAGDMYGTNAEQGGNLYSTGQDQAEGSGNLYNTGQGNTQGGQSSSMYNTGQGNSQDQNATSNRQQNQSGLEGRGFGGQSSKKGKAPSSGALYQARH
jgi:hypothetical protein